MQGGGERRAVEGRPTPVVDVIDVEVVLEEQQVLRPRPPDQIERGRVRSHHQVRAVVDVLAGDGVAVGGRPAAEHAPALQQRHLVAALLEVDGRGEAGEAGADDDGLHGRRERRRVRSAIHALRVRERLTRPSGGYPRRAISSSSAA